MKQADSVPNPGAGIGASQQSEVGNASAEINHLSITLLFVDQARAHTLEEALRAQVALIPIETALVEHVQQLKPAVLVTDMKVDAIKELGIHASCTLCICIDNESVGAEDPFICLEDTSDLSSQVAREVMSRLFPGKDQHLLSLEGENQRLSEAIQEIGRELSIFYHNINNPLTILSGNIQLLQLMADSLEISADLMKPIEDIASISGRFSEDLQAIAMLKEKIKSGRLQVVDPCTDN